MATTISDDNIQAAYIHLKEQIHAAYRMKLKFGIAWNKRPMDTVMVFSPTERFARLEDQAEDLAHSNEAARNPNVRYNMRRPDTRYFTTIESSYGTFAVENSSFIFNCLTASAPSEAHLKSFFFGLGMGQFDVVVNKAAAKPKPYYRFRIPAPKKPRKQRWVVKPLT